MGTFRKLKFTVGSFRCQISHRKLKYSIWVGSVRGCWGQPINTLNDLVNIWQWFLHLSTYLHWISIKSFLKWTYFQVSHEAVAKQMIDFSLQFANFRTSNAHLPLKAITPWREESNLLGHSHLPFQVWGAVPLLHPLRISNNGVLVGNFKSTLCN